jgi:hypothetical protein
MESKNETALDRLGRLLLTSSAMAEPAKCTATAEATNGHVIFHVEPKECAKILYTVGRRTDLHYD